MTSSQAAARTTDDEVRALVDAEQIHLLYSRGKAPYVGNFVNAGLFAFIIWHALPHPRVIGWLAALAISNLGRALLDWAYCRRPRSPVETRRWAVRFTAATLVSGILWGSASVLLYVPGALSLQMFLMLLMCGMIASATGLHSSYPPSFYAAELPMLVPLAIRLALERDGFHLALSAMTVLYILFMGRYVNESARTLRHASELRFQNALLNQTLESRVAERTAQLEAALAEVEAALRIRDEFITVASHELLTPLTSLKVQLQTLLREWRRSGVRTRAKLGVRGARLLHQTTRMSALVRTLLDVAQIDRGTLKLEPAAVDFSDVVRRVANDMEEDFRRRGSALHISVPPSLPGMWDAARLEQITFNLVSNAAKYGAAKPVSIVLADDGEHAVLTVADEGIGMSRDELARVFGKYERAVAAKLYGGLGLGLFIVRHLVLAMGGTIDVCSRPHQGTRVTIRLPRRWATRMKEQGEQEITRQEILSS
jgi:signal transduction histidine kinase